MQDDKAQEFLQKLKDSGHWNDDYDYSKVVFINNTTKVIIFDKNFSSEHLITPKNLLKGSKCCSQNLKDGCYKYDEAKKYVHSLKLENLNSWREWSSSGGRPHFIPGNPYGYYSNEWESWTEWLGNTNISVRDREYLPFDESRNIVRKFGLKTSSDWKIFSKTKRPNNIPSRPDQVYKEQWLSWGDWFGTKIGFGGFYSFEDAKEFIKKEGISNVNDWQKYEKPIFIPTNPSRTYKDEWISWSDFLGTKNISNSKLKFISFIEAREYARNFNFSGESEWRKFSKSGNKPDNIPATPSQVYKDEWISWYDFLGTKIGFDGNYLSYDEAKKIIHKLNLETYQEFKDAHINGLIPNNIPYSIYVYYKDNGWISISDFLGSNKVTNYEKSKNFLTFEGAREFVRNIGLKNQNDYKSWCKSGNKPDNIPANPNKVYEDKWLSMADWLGIHQGWCGDYLPYDEAKKLVKDLNFESISEWKEWSKSKNRPLNIPSHPHKIYKNDGWTYWGDFLGTNRVATYNVDFLDYMEAKKLVMKLNLKSKTEWELYCKSGKRLNNIPMDPVSVYSKNNEWESWSDFLGYIGNGKHHWSKSAILSFIKSLKSELINLDSVELITIINSNNLAKKIKELGRLEDLVSSSAGTQERQNIVNNIIDNIGGGQGELEDNTETIDDGSEFEETLEEDDTSGVTEETGEEELEPLNPIQELHMYDNNMVTASLDDENIDFLMKNQLKKLWNRVLNNKVDVEQYQQETGGERFTIIKNWFFEEYDEVNKIQSPSDYIFKYQPNLMQRLVTYRLTKELRYGNWSGTGAGKTLSAIFAGRYAGAKNTLIICNNATVEGWVNSIHEYFTNNKVYTKRELDYTDSKLYTVVDKYNVKFSDGDNNYFVLNYETFQQEDGEYVVSELLKNNTIDYIILDEVQNVKQRDDEESTRRNVINKLVIHSSEKNEELLVMAMSATPVINNLTEPKKLIELLTGELHNELETRENILNGIEMYKALTRHGLRYKPNYGITVNEEIVEVDGSHLSEKIIKIPRGAVVEFESVLINTKLDAIANKITKGTLVYTHYVTEFSHVIGEYIKKLGFTVGYYTGQDKSGLRLFKEGKIDVLVGSAPVGTGVDGIQYVCNTLIPIVLPWTSSEYDQLVGRIDRQGSHFDHVNIYIPQVTIQLEDGIWSWDKRRHNIIKFKATLADLAVDGRVPKNLLPSRSKLVEDAKKELADWVNRLQGGDFITFEREEMVIPLNPKLIERNRNQLGDFSDMNKRWSTTRSDNTHERLSKDPREWYYYHTLYSEKRKTWSEIPYIEIAKKIQSRPDWVVGDFGCGENLLSKEIKNKVYAFDHVAIDDDVIACDIVNVPIEDGILDVAVFSLSIMGSNDVEYFKEAYRTLKTYGNIFVCEPAKKWKGKEDKLKKLLESVGFKCFGAVKNTDKFIYIDGIKY